MLISFIIFVTFAASFSIIHSKICLYFLETGNANGLGPIRKKELEEACKFLGISGQYGGLDIIDDSRLPDGLRTEWPEHVVSEHVLSATKRISPDIVSGYKISNGTFFALYFRQYGPW